MHEHPPYVGCDCDVCQDARQKGRERCFVKVWRFEDAPPEFRALSQHGGDEDWVAWIPASMAEDNFFWMEEGTPFGCNSVSEHRLDDGSVVRIGAHA